MADDYFWAQYIMYEYKIRMCMRGGCRGCWLAHPGSPTRRRNHRWQQYSCKPCFYFSNNGFCPYEDDCSYSHGNYEMWYHPDYYRVHPCPSGLNCRSIRFCPYHHNQQLRLADRNLVRPSYAAVVRTLHPSPPPPPPMMRQSNSRTPPRPRPMMQQPNSQTPPRPRPMMQQPNSQTPPPPTRVMQRPQSPQRHQLTDSSGAIPHLQADAASFRTKRKHDHEAGSSNN